MILKSLVLSCVAALGLAGGTALAGQTYVNGIDPNYPPFAFLNEKLEPSGFDVDSMNWIAQKMGFVVKHQAMDWDGIIPSLLAKKIDMICSGMSISPERRERVNFSQPYWKIRKYLLIRQDSSLTASELLSGGKTLGVQSGTNEAEYLRERAGKNGWNYSLKYYDAAYLAIQDLLNNRLDGAAMDSAPAEEAIHKGKKAVKIVGEFAEQDDFGVAVRKEDAALLEIINKGYALLMQDPYWEELKIKYFSRGQ
ncbi:MAG: ABC transporter substrate-binding protein [Desulfovibrio sp.]|jgi:polar amino acid transport system substrate-binding protein|nr:ABC transporter substrate-binding protein [Desulfovibrio sp.]